jgi:hypothetical protein
MPCNRTVTQIAVVLVELDMCELRFGMQAIYPAVIHTNQMNFIEFSI